ncbi:PD-(D/E)XK nuclease family protein [Methylobacterium sp. A54F]
MPIKPHLAGLVPGPGLYQMPAAAYHADPSPEPSLSASTARMLVEQSAEHAWIAHPRLGCALETRDEPTRPKEIGTAAHKLILGRGAEIVLIDADDYRTGAAKAERAQAYADGHCPLLQPDGEKADAIADQVVERLARIPGCEGFATAPSEVVAVKRDRSGAWLRIMMDRFEDHGTHAVIWDLKTGDTAAAPQGLGRRVEGMAMEVQAALYVRVVETLLPRLAGRVTFRWVFVENAFPHALSVAEIDAAGLHVGGRKVAAAIHRWNACRAADRWPGYPEAIVRVDYPEWASKRWAEREELDPQLAGVPYDVATSPFRPLDMESAA